MSFKMRASRVVIGTAVFAALSLGATGAAFAESHGASLTGAQAWSSGSKIYIKDTGDDSQWVRANWNSATGSGGLSNQSGYNTVASQSGTKVITAVQACKSRTALPMTCSGWNNDY